MIVRILNDNQYIVPSLYYDEINALDNALVQSIAGNDRDAFRICYDRMIELVKKNGVPMDPYTVKESDLILPPPDMTFEEARKLFVGEGLIPD
ncbi:PspA-associated protein PspAA [Methanocella arvoryzae]|uniref:PspA-associated domain-containing protein n=1 Tax=Methanocella arvoryzae (strain DSM 22066 / NBRC 105507 / MRE50) TaxID=351160 RepID=Q0W7U8_METAR|nr:hypothetical protein [Methanocella arvoryzae]CAJ35545.1 conserved hypothetical protein [Methanocella arvoryzae MRE50]